MIFGTQLSEILSDVALKHYDSEELYREAISAEHDRIISEYKDSMSPDDMVILSSVKAVLFWSYQYTQK